MGSLGRARSEPTPRTGRWCLRPGGGRTGRGEEAALAGEPRSTSVGGFLCVWRCCSGLQWGNSRGRTWLEPCDEDVDVAELAVGLGGGACGAPGDDLPVGHPVLHGGEHQGKGGSWCDTTVLHGTNLSRAMQHNSLSILQGCLEAPSSLPWARSPVATRPHSRSGWCSRRRQRLHSSPGGWMTCSQGGPPGC